MPFSEGQLAQMKHAYHVLGLPLSATPAAIKQGYRKLVKRWHPDLYKSGTEEQAEATQMTKLINESYLLIQDSPLSYYAGAYPSAYASARQAARPAPPTHQPPDYPKVESILKFTWLEFWIRFICGAVFGAMVGFRVWYLFDSARTFVFGEMAMAFLFGLLAAKGGDRFWHASLGRWWMWW